MEFYIMYRNGIIVPSKYTPNQCKVNGHPVYYYTLAMVFPKAVRLDKDRFIIDHQYVDNLITKMGLTGSCEDMHRNICAAVQEFFAEKGIKLIACKCTIKPSESNNQAYMEYVYLHNRRDAFVLASIQ